MTVHKPTKYHYSLFSRRRTIICKKPATSYPETILLLPQVPTILSSAFHLILVNIVSPSSFVYLMLSVSCVR